MAAKDDREGGADSRWKVEYCSVPWCLFCGRGSDGSLYTPGEVQDMRTIHAGGVQYNGLHIISSFSSVPPYLIRMHTSSTAHYCGTKFRDAGLARGESRQVQGLDCVRLMWVMGSRVLHDQQASSPLLYGSNLSAPTQRSLPDEYCYCSGMYTEIDLGSLSSHATRLASNSFTPL
jgi:hypothetical protein